jgi:hypothetical protein
MDLRESVRFQGREGLVPQNLLQHGLMCIENLVDGHLHIPIEG